MKTQAMKLTSAHVSQFEKCQSQVDGLYAETSQLAKKSPNDGVNKFKLKFINQTLELCSGLLGDQYKPFSEFTVFSDEELPTTSDVVLMLSQYAIALEKFRDDNISFIQNSWQWLVSDGAVIGTTMPKNQVARRRDKK
jgi:hypothetical protein